MSQTYQEFAESAQKQEAPFDWSTDSCSPPTPTAWAKAFHRACVMHDFGYRNYGSPGPKGLHPLDPTENRRLAIDNRFLQEMQRICDDQPGVLPDCRGAAQLMHRAVRLLGGPAFYGPVSGKEQESRQG
ncbi:phospholipase A2 [Streptomyces syringium]|uniref:phospholipase A2 n=1 Tax=Streptomyces syringium TaxID=76729 RepID=UPI003454F33B